MTAVLTLATGTAIAQAIPVAISPILTRLYTPEEWGTFSLFMTITATLGAAAAGRYELAIMLPDADDDARALAVLGMLISGALATLVLIPTLVFPEALARLIGEPDLAPWLVLASPTVFFIGVFNCLNYLTTRDSAFRTVAVANVSKATVGAATQLALGLAMPGPGGLIVGYTVSSAAANVWLARRNLTLRKGVSVARSQLVAVARRFADFPKYSVGSAVAQTATLALIAVMITRFYSVDSLGEYALVQRVLGLPLVLIGGSVGQVYFQRASAEQREVGDFVDSFMTTLRALSAVAVMTTVVLYLTLPLVFSTVFGSDWAGAGDLARSLLPGFAMQFVVSPLSLSNQINMRNRFGLIGNIVVLIVMCASLLVSAMLGSSVRIALLQMSIVQGCYYAGFLYLIFRHVSAARVRGSNE